MMTVQEKRYVPVATDLGRTVMSVSLSWSHTTALLRDLYCSSEICRSSIRDRVNAVFTFVALLVCHFYIVLSLVLQILDLLWFLYKCVQVVVVFLVSQMCLVACACVCHDVEVRVCACHNVEVCACTDTLCT